MKTIFSKRNSAGIMNNNNKATISVVPASNPFKPAKLL